MRRRPSHSSRKPVGKRRLVGAWIGAFAAISMITTFLVMGRARPPGYTAASVPEAGPGPAPASAAGAATTKEPKDALACQSFYRWTCGSAHTVHDPSGVVLRDVEAELSSLRIYEEIIRSNPDDSSEQIDARLSKSIFTARRTERIVGVFHWIKSRMLAWIKSIPEDRMSLEIKAQLTDRIQKTRLDLPDDKGHGYADEPDLLTKSGAFYERTQEGDRLIRLGGAYVQGTSSLFNLSYTLGHELAHSIDPCELEDTGVPGQVFGRVEECLIQQKIIPKLPAKSRCQAGDLLSEAFADWVAAELVTRRLKEFANEFDSDQLRASVINSVRDLCRQGEALREYDSTFHPKPEVRIEALFGQHPVLRELLGCPTYPNPNPATGYCHL